MSTGGLSDFKFIFIINPNAGNHKIEQFVSNNTLSYVIENTKGPGDATIIAHKYASAYGSKCRFVSVGGDGTLNEVLNGMAESGAQLSIIPAGSGNDFIKSVIPSYKKKQKISYEFISSILTGSPKPIDLAAVNDRYFLNIASVGFDADVVYNAIRFKKTILPAKLSYYMSVFLSLIHLKSRKVTVSIDGNNVDKVITLIAVANGKYYGGGFTPAPGASIEDGILDVCCVEKITRRKVLRFFTKYKEGTHGSIQQVSFDKCRNITVESKDEVRVNIDGELLISKKAVFKICDFKINFIIPD
jgi:YegS/Rv2252/BmrU family lipid kinase